MNESGRTLPQVSIVIPAWNAEAALPACLDSVTKQTYPELQILIVDDGSTDQTAEVIRRYAEKDSRVHAIHQANGGVAAARNAALPLCTGKYIRFVDSDDHLPPDSIENLVNRAEETEADLVLAGYRTVLAGKSREHNMIPLRTTKDLKSFLKTMHGKTNSFYIGSLWNKLFRTSILRETGACFTGNLTYGEDFLFVMNYLTGVRTLAFTDQVVYEYIRHPGSLTFRQVQDCLIHPLNNIRVKLCLYRGMCETYRGAGLYEAYRFRLMLYLFRVTLNE